MTSRIRLALVGAGNMGRHHARVIGDSPDSDLVVVIDKDIERARALAAEHGCAAAAGLEATRGCDAAIVAASTEDHVAIGRELLGAGLPLFIEKPVALTVPEVTELCELAQRQVLPLMCGFVERFNAVVITAASIIDGRPVHAVSLRHSPHTPQARTSVVWDLLIHDIDLALRFIGEPVTSVVAQRATLPPLGIVEVADTSLRFQSGAVTTHSASRAGQRKTRSWQLVTDEAMYDIDLLRQDVTVYRHVSAELLFNALPRYRAETAVDIPFVRHGGEPLALQLDHFISLLAGVSDIDAERESILPAHAVAAKVDEA